MTTEIVVRVRPKPTDDLGGPGYIVTAVELTVDGVHINGNAWCEMVAPRSGPPIEDQIADAARRCVRELL